MSDYRVSNGESFIKFGGVREVEGGGVLTIEIVEIFK